MDTKLRVLLIEDDEDDFVMTRDLLEQSSEYKYDLQWEKDYDCGIEFIGKEKSDVCLLDYRLGKYDGLKFLKEAITNGCKIPIIIMTGKGDHEIDMEAMKTGAADYLAKGQITAILLERSILHAIERKEAEQKLQKTLTDLERFNKLMVGRELRFIELKKEINALLAELSREPQYPSVLEGKKGGLSSDKAVEDEAYKK